MIKYLKTAKLKNKTVLLRVDVNEPIGERGVLEDDFRIRAIIPTIQFLVKQSCKVIIAGHLGRPEGKWDESLTLRPVAQRLAELLTFKFVETEHGLPDYPVNHLIFFRGNITDLKTSAQVQAVPEKDIVFLENLRFYPGEEENSPAFSKTLANLCDVYVNDAFAVSHRDSASIVGITKHRPSYAGLLLDKEIKSLTSVLVKPKSPFVVMIGGIKISEKAKTLEHLGKKADKILLGGGIANMIFLAKGISVGKSNVESEARETAWHLLQNFGDKIILPLDVVVANSNYDKSSIRVCNIHDVKKDEMILDLGPKSILQFATELKKAKTVVWNGPLGLFEEKPFATGTLALAKIVGAVSSGRAYGVVGGGETVDAVRHAHQAEFIDHVSTGGGAMLEFLSGDKLPGIKALE